MQLSARISSGAGSGSAEFTSDFLVVSDQEPPTPPLNLAFDIDGGNVEATLTWTAASDRVVAGEIVGSEVNDSILSGGGLIHRIVIRDVTDGFEALTPTEFDRILALGCSGDINDIPESRRAQVQVVRCVRESADPREGYVLTQEGGGAVMAHYRLTRSDNDRQAN